MVPLLALLGLAACTSSSSGFDTPGADGGVGGDAATPPDPSGDGGPILQGGGDAEPPKLGCSATSATSSTATDR